MSNDDDDLPFGLYERLVTAGLKARLLRFGSTTTRIVTEELDATEAHATLARHIANLVAGVLRALPQPGPTMDPKEASLSRASASSTVTAYPLLPRSVRLSPQRRRLV